MQALRRLAKRIVSPPPSVAVIKLQGLISSRPGAPPNSPGVSMDKVAKWADKAFRARRNLRAVALAINSPGGSPAQSELVAKYIRSKAEETKLPVWAFAEDVAASGGYWLMCAADKGKLYSCESSVVGSVGVISQSFGLSEVLKRLGVENRTNTAGKFKGMGNMFMPVKEEEQERLRVLLASLHGSFKDAILENRGDALKAKNAKPEDVFTGEAFTGRQALELGLVDGLGDMHSRLRAEYGKDVELRVVNPTSMGRFSFARASSGGSSSYGDHGGSMLAGLHPSMDPDAIMSLVHMVTDEMHRQDLNARCGAGF